MSEIKCEVVRDLMPLVADEVASEASRELVNGHIEGCEVCRAYYEGMTAQLARTAVPEDKSAFVAFSHRMEKRVRLKKVLTALVAAIIALCVVVVGIGVVYDRMNTYDVMPIEKTQAWLWHESNGDVSVMVRMQDGHGWYGDVAMAREGDIVYLMPQEPQLKLWNRGATGGLYNVGWFDLLWEDDQLYYYLSVTHSEYNIETGWFEDVDEEYKIPISYVRWGWHDNYTTLYEEGDVIPTMSELKTQIDANEVVPEEPKDPGATVVPTAIATSVPSVGEGD